MKTLLTLIFLLTASISWTQELELDFAHRYGIIENDLRHGVEFIEYFDEFNKWVVAGYFDEEVDVGINSTAVLYADAEENPGFVVIYDENFDVLDYFKTGGLVNSVALTETDIIVCGSFVGTADFDYQDDNNELYESEASGGNGYLASYSISQGNLNWINIFYSTVSNQAKFCFYKNGRVYSVFRFTGSSSTSSLNLNGETDLSIFSASGVSVVFFEFNVEGEYLFHNQFLSEEISVTPEFSLVRNNKLYLSFDLLLSGSLNVGILEPVNFQYENNLNQIVCAYDLSSKELLEYYSFKGIGPGSAAQGGAIAIDKTTNDLLIGMRNSGQVEILTSGTGEISNQMFNDELGEIVIYKFNNGQEIVNSLKYSSNEFLAINDLISFGNQDLFLAITYKSNLFFDGNLIGQNDQNQFVNTLVYLNSNYNGSEVFEFSASGDENNINDLVNPTPGILVVGGAFEGQHDFDFSDDFFSLGDVSDDISGYTARYSFDSENYIHDSKFDLDYIYPNPTSEKLFVSKKSDKAIHYRIYNSYGVIVKSGRTESNAIEVETLSKGLYALEVQNRIFQFLIN